MVLGFVLATACWFIMGLVPTLAGGGRRHVALRPRRGLQAPALLRVRRGPRPAGPGRDVHGLRLSPDRYRHLHRRLVERLPGEALRRGRQPRRAADVVRGRGLRHRLHDPHDPLRPLRRPEERGGLILSPWTTATSPPSS